MPLWLSSYGLLLQWQARKLSTLLPFVLVVQALLAVGVVVGFGFLLPEVDPQTALFLSTGAPTLTLVIVGLVIVPQQVGTAKTEGSYAYTRSLPVPRMAFLAADATVWLLVSLPGLALALVVGALRYDLTFSLSPLLPAAVLLVALTSIAVGYAIASLTHPLVAALISQVLVFAVLMFSPINFPAERLPGWLAAVHEVLPVQYMAELLRATLAQAQFDLRPLPFLVVGAWCLASFAATAVVLTRRG